MSNLEVALGYIGRGWHVFPTHWITAGGTCSCGRTCSSPGKHPRPRRGALDATDDPARAGMWWGDLWPNANVAIATGWISKVYVLDLDGAEGLDTWDALTLIHDVSPTLTARTGSGGQHIYFAMEHVSRTLPNTAKKLGPGIDTRGRGGYVLAPPSNHVSGGRYEWLNDQPPASLPGWIISELAARERGVFPEPRIAHVSRARDDDPVAVRILDEEMALVAGTAPGFRNDQLFKSAAAVFEIAYAGAIRPESVAAGMVDAGMACGLSLSEIQATIKSAQQHGRDNPREIRTGQAEGAAR